MSAVLTSQVPSQEENMPPLDPPVSHYVLNRRRHGISSGLTVEAVYQSEPRMNRRNAISYESDDAAAKYIRYLVSFHQVARTTQLTNVAQSHQAVVVVAQSMGASLRKLMPCYDMYPKVTVVSTIATDVTVSTGASKVAVSIRAASVPTAAAKSVSVTVSSRATSAAASTDVASSTRATDVASSTNIKGDALSQRQVTTVQRSTTLPELPNSYKLSPSISRRRGRRGSFQQITPSKCYRDALKGSAVHRFDCEAQAKVIQDSLKNVDSWDFDVFAMRRITEGRPLFYIGLNLLFQKSNVLNLDILTAMRFLAMVEEAYHPDNCYHNSTHAADVTQALHCLLKESKLQAHLTPIEITACILAAICHDLDHPGVNQNFLLNTSSYLATIHGANSILERHHCHTAKAILKETGLLNHLTVEQRTEFLTLMEDLILATDVSRHKDFMSRFEEMLVSPRGLDFSNKEQRHFILMIAIKAADISNPTRSLPLSKAWSEHIMEEFFRQGDNERSMKLPISFLCDRTTTTIPKSQSGFFEFVALPLFKAWSKLFNSRLSLHLCKNILRNKEYWDTLIPRTPSDSEEDSS